MKIGKLKKRIAILKQTEGREEERRKLEAEYKELKSKEGSRIFQQKHRKKIAIVKGAGTGLSRIGRGLSIMAKGVAKKIQNSEGLKRQYSEMYGPQEPRKKIAVIKSRNRRKR